MRVSFSVFSVPRILSAVSCILYFVSCIFAIPAQAAGIGVSVQPFLSDLVFEEGETEKPFVVTLSNDADTEARFDVFAVDFGSLDVSAGVAFLGAARDIEQSYSRAQWIALESDTVTVPAGGTAELHGKLINTPDLAPGGHYGAILLTTGQPDALAMGPANVAIDQRLSALVFLKKRGGERYGMEFVSSSMDRDIFGSVRSMRLAFRNMGNVHIVPRGRADLLDPRGRLVAKGIVNEDSSIVLPGATRDMSVKMRPVMTAWVPGMYTLRLGYRYDGLEAFETVEERVFVVPPAFIAGCIGLIAVFAADRIARRKRRARG